MDMSAGHLTLHMFKVCQMLLPIGMMIKGITSDSPTVQKFQECTQARMESLCQTHFSKSTT
jgi:hypothetical protein